MISCDYLMECDEEAYRLDIKTDETVVTELALWAGLKAGMRVADVGCGAGRSAVALKRITGTNGQIVGIDASEARVSYATKNYSEPGLTFTTGDVLSDLGSNGKFDFIWVRFLLEYYQKEAGEIVANLKKLLNPGGVICLADLDHNSLNHYQLSEELERSVQGLMQWLYVNANFDPYIGRKLYSFLFDSGFSSIRARVDAHHLIYGNISAVDMYNWSRKLEVAAKNSGYDFSQYTGGFEKFSEDFKTYLQDPRMFTYTPLITCVATNN